MWRGLQQHRDPRAHGFIPAPRQDGTGWWWRGTGEFVIEPDSSGYWAQGLGPRWSQGSPTAGDSPIHAVTPQQAARTQMGRTGWQGLHWIAPAQQQDSADGCGVRMVSGHGVKWAVELGQGDTFHTHYCDMSSACKVRRGKREVSVGGSRSRPAAAGLGAGATPQSRAWCGALPAQGLSAHCPGGTGQWRGSGISLLHSAGKHLSQEVPHPEV